MIVVTHAEDVALQAQRRIRLRDGKVVKTGGIEWTIKDGIPFHVPTISAEIRDMVAKARSKVICRSSTCSRTQLPSRH